MSEKTIKIETECKDCVFFKQIFEDDFPQEWDMFDHYDCELERIDKFREQKLVKHIDGYPVIKGICNAKRDQQWVDELGIEDVEAKVKEQIQITNDFLIISYDDEHIAAKLMRSAKQCAKQTLPPRNVIFIVKAEHIANFQELYWDLHHGMDEKIRFYFIRIIDHNKKDYECIDEAYKKIQSFYYTVWRAGKDIPEDYNEKLNKSINEDLRKISMIHPADDPLHGLTIQTAVHKLVGGNKERPIYQKIPEIAKSQDLESMVVQYEEL